MFALWPFKKSLSIPKRLRSQAASFCNFQNASKIIPVGISTNYQGKAVLAFVTDRQHRILSRYIPKGLPDTDELMRFLPIGSRIDLTWVYPESMECFIEQVEKNGYAKTVSPLYSPFGDGSVRLCHIMGIKKGNYFALQIYKEEAENLDLSQTQLSVDD